MADIPLVQLPYPEEETRTFELSTSLSPNWDKNGRIYYTDETGQVVRPQTKYNPLQMLGRRLKAFGSNAKNFVEDFNMDKSHTYFAPFEDINKQYKAGNIDKSELPYLAQGRAEQEIRDAQQQERDNINRGWLGTGLSAASMLPIFNIPYVGTGLGGAMYDLGQGITEGNNAGELWDRTKRGFAIGESVGAIPYVGKLAGKTKAGQAVGSAFNNAGEKFANTKLYDALMTDIKAFNPNKQTVYHGSPYDFNKFSNEAIGTGEGAQAHGYGHYAALNKDVAERYAETISGEKPIGVRYKGENYEVGFNPKIADWEIKGNVESLTPEERHLFELIDSNRNLEDIKGKEQKNIDRLIRMKGRRNRFRDAQKSKDIINLIDNNDVEILPENKQLYKLSVPKNDVMLREGARLDKQPQIVQDAFNQIRQEYLNLPPLESNDELIKYFENNLQNGIDDFFEREATKNALRVLNGEKLSANGWQDLNNLNYQDLHKLDAYFTNGEDILKRLQNQFWDKPNKEELAQKILYDKGIKGISYNGGIDGEARVIFNPDDIVIGRKYYNQPNLYQQLTGKQNTGALVDALLNR